MPTAPSNVETLPFSALNGQLTAVVERIARRGARVLIEQSGAPIAAIISTEDLRRLERLDAERAERFKILDEMQAKFAGVSEEEIERETAKAVAEVRAEMQAEREQAARKS